MNWAVGCKINLTKFRWSVLVDNLVYKWADDIQDDLPVTKDRLKIEASLHAGGGI